MPAPALAVPQTNSRGLPSKLHRLSHTCCAGVYRLEQLLAAVPPRISGGTIAAAGVSRAAWFISLPVVLSGAAAAMSAANSSKVSGDASLLAVWLLSLPCSSGAAAIWCQTEP